MTHSEFMAVCKEVADLVAQKGQDYNHAISRGAYFPFGHQSYIQLIYMKALRMVSLALNPKRKVNFESSRDSAMDVIAYAVFYINYLKSKEKRNARNAK